MSKKGFINTIFTAKVLLIIAIGVAAGTIVYFSFIKKAERPPIIQVPVLNEADAKSAVAGFLKAEQERNFDSAKPFLDARFASTIDPAEFAGTSDPHIGRFEIRGSRLLPDRGTYKVDARVYQEYAGSGEAGYRDNSYFVGFSYGRYLIYNIKYGKYIQLKSGRTSGWKTYRNTRYGFEIKYPQEWIIGLGGTTSDVVEWAASERGAGVPWVMDLMVSERNGKSVNEWLVREGYRKDFPYEAAKDIEVAGVKGKIVRDTVTMGSDYYIAFFPVKNYMFSLGIASSPPKIPGDPVSLLVKILSTFKFH